MLDVCNLKHDQGEPFVTFLQRWRKLCSRYSRDVLEKEKIDILVSNLVLELRNKIGKWVFDTFHTMVQTTFCIEDVLKNQGIIKHNSNKNNNNNGNKNRSTSYKWNQHVVNDGIVDAPKSDDQVVYKLSNSVEKL